MSTAIQEEISKRVAELPETDQRRVLEVVQQLGGILPPGVPGTEYLRRVRGLIPLADAEEMMRAIEEDCENIDPSDW